MTNAASPTHDEAAIRALLDELAAAWNRGDGAAYGALFSQDADYIDVTGTHTRGGDAIGRAHQAMFDSFLKGSVLASGSAEAAVSMLTPEVALVIASGAARLAGQASVPADRQSINTTLLLKRDGLWRIRAFQNSRVQSFPGGPPARPGASQAS